MLQEDDIMLKLEVKYVPKTKKKDFLSAKTLCAKINFGVLGQIKNPDTTMSEWVQDDRFIEELCPKFVEKNALI